MALKFKSECQETILIRRWSRLQDENGCSNLKTQKYKALIYLEGNKRNQKEAKKKGNLQLKK